MLRCLLLILSCGLWGCASDISTDPDGVLSARCPDGGMSRCHDMARRHCGKAGYRTLSEVSDTGSKTGGTGDSLINARAAVRILTFRCKAET